MRHVSPELLILFFRWVCRRQARMSARTCYPEIAYHLERHGLAYEHHALGFLVGFGRSFREDDESDEIGWAYLDLPEWEQTVLWNWATMGGDEWQEWSRAHRLSWRKLHAIKLALQDAAIRRGLVTVIDVSRDWSE